MIKYDANVRCCVHGLMCVQCDIGKRCCVNALMKVCVLCVLCAILQYSASVRRCVSSTIEMWRTFYVAHSMENIAVRHHTATVIVVMMTTMIADVMTTMIAVGGTVDSRVHINVS
jgi:hypothetical protein